MANRKTPKKVHVAWILVILCALEASIYLTVCVDAASLQVDGALEDKLLLADSFSLGATWHDSVEQAEQLHSLSSDNQTMFRDPHAEFTQKNLAFLDKQPSRVPPPQQIQAHTSLRSLEGGSGSSKDAEAGSSPPSGKRSSSSGSSNDVDTKRNNSGESTNTKNEGSALACFLGLLTAVAMIACVGSKTPNAAAAEDTPDTTAVGPTGPPEEKCLMTPLKSIPTSLLRASSAKLRSHSAKPLVLDALGCRGGGCAPSKEGASALQQQTEPTIKPVKRPTAAIPMDVVVPSGIFPDTESHQPLSRSPSEESDDLRASTDSSYDDDDDVDGALPIRFDDASTTTDEEAASEPVSTHLELQEELVETVVGPEECGPEQLAEGDGVDGGPSTVPLLLKLDSNDDIWITTAFPTPRCHTAVPVTLPDKAVPVTLPDKAVQEWGAPPETTQCPSENTRDCDALPVGALTDVAAIMVSPATYLTAYLAENSGTPRPGHEHSVAHVMPRSNTPHTTMAESVQPAASGHETISGTLSEVEEDHEEVDLNGSLGLLGNIVQVATPLVRAGRSVTRVIAQLPIG